MTSMPDQLPPKLNNTAVLLALAARCETASGPDRELDAAIACTTIPGAELASGDLTEAGELWVPCDDTRADSALVGAANYTASIDAALTLVPDGYFVDRIGQYADMSMWGVIIFHQSDLGLHFPLYGEATSGARSAGAAALRARAQYDAACATVRELETNRKRNK